MNIDQNKESIKRLGNIVTVIAVVIIFSNGSGALAFNLLFSNTEHSIDSPFLYFNYIVITAIILAISFFTSGIFISKFKNWARVTCQITAVVFIITIWGLMFFLGNNIQQFSRAFSFFPILVAAFWSTPLVYLIIYLNKQDIRSQFN